MSGTQTLADRLSVMTTLAHHAIRAMSVSIAVPFGRPDTSTSPGVRNFNGAKIDDGRVPGPITKRPTDACIAEVGCVFVKQYLDRLS
jgi:hypothetical protein